MICCPLSFNTIIFSKIGYIKPIGQRYLEEEGFKIDEDSILIEKAYEEAYGVKCGLKDMSPIAVDKGFTERYINNPDKEEITKQIKESFARISKDKDLTIIEGTGHAGVGSVFDHSNASVAKLLGSKIILVSSGGIGRPIDEIMLNYSLFKQEGVELIGVIINKVLPAKFDKVSSFVKKGLKKKGIDVLGVMPHNPVLNIPTIAQILEETDFELLSGKEGLNNTIHKILVGAMQPREALNYIVDKSLVITPGDRDDILLMAVSSHLTAQKGSGSEVAGIILTGNMKPHQAILSLVKDTKIPLIVSKDDTYVVASLVHDLTVKIRPQDKDKINSVIKMVKDNVDFDKIIERM